MIFFYLLLLFGVQADIYNQNPVADVTIFNDGGASGLGDNLYAGMTYRPNEIRRFMFKWDLTSIPPGSTINRANSYIEIRMAKTRSPIVHPCYLHRVLQDWNEGPSPGCGRILDGTEGWGCEPETGDTTWDERNYGSEEYWWKPGGDFQATVSRTFNVQCCSGGETNHITFNDLLEEDAQHFIDYPQQNFGWIMLCVEDLDTRSATMWRSKDNDPPRPILYIDYTPPGTPPVIPPAPAIVPNYTPFPKEGRITIRPDIENQYPACLMVYPANEFRICWKYEDSDDHFEMAFQAKDTSQFGVGFVPAGWTGQYHMADTADSWVASWSDNPADDCYQGCLLDLFFQKTDNLNPPNCTNTQSAFCDPAFPYFIDTVNDLTQSNVNLTDDGYMTATFTRVLNTGNVNEDVEIIPTGGMRLFWSINVPWWRFTEGSSPDYKMYMHTLYGEVPNFDFSWNQGPQPNTTNSGSVETMGGQYKLNWTVLNNEITFFMDAETLGWVCIGFGKKSSSKKPYYQVDYIVGFVDDQGAVHIWDMYDHPPNNKMDEEFGGGNDLYNLWGKEENGRTVLRFSRLINTGDDYDIDLSGTVYGFWGFGIEDGNPVDHTLTGHGGVNPSSRCGYLLFDFASGSIKNIPKDDMTPINNPGLYIGAILLVGLIGYSGIIWLRKRKSGHSKIGSKSIDGHGETEHDETYYKASQKILVIKRKQPNTFVKLASSQFFSTEVSLIEVLIALVYVITNVLILIFMFPSKTWGSRTGWLCCINTIVTLIPATRNSILVFLTGISFERVIILHRWLGKWLLLLVIAHLGSLVYTYLTPPMNWSISQVIDSILSTSEESHESLWGTTALLILIIIYISSLETIRRRFFESFYFTHHLFIIYIFMFWHHSPQSKIYIIGIAALLVIDRALRWIRAGCPYKSISIRNYPHDLVKIKFPVKQLNFMCRKYLFDVGQYSFINFPSVNILQWHPYSMYTNLKEDNEYMTVAIRNLGDHTSKLINHCKKTDTSHIWMRIDGPYGKPKYNYRRYPNIVCISGGCGLAPVLSYLYDLYNTKTLVKNFHLIWTIPYEGCYEWFKEELEEIKKMSEGKKIDLFISIYVTRQAKTENKDLLVGHPDWKVEFDRICEMGNESPMWVMTCGPSRLKNAVWKEASRHSNSKQRIDFNLEAFEW